MHSLDANTDTATINGHCERQKKVECNICIRTAGQVSRIPVANGDNGWGLFTSATVDGPVLRSFSFRHSITSKRSAWRSNYLANLAFPPGSESRIPVKQTFLAPFWNTRACHLTCCYAIYSPDNLFGKCYKIFCSTSYLG